MRLITDTRVVLFLAVAGLFVRSAAAQPLAKAQVANLIVKVENGVDDFRKYLEQRGENISNAGANAPAKRRGGMASESQKAKGNAKKDQLEDALDELNQSTNRLRRKFDTTDTWMETKAQVERVVDDGRKLNQVVARGSYGAEAARLWAALRSRINDLARAYGVAPLAV
jgi:hypothetical protein